MQESKEIETKMTIREELDALYTSIKKTIQEKKLAEKNEVENK